MREYNGKEIKKIAETAGRRFNARFVLAVPVWDRYARLGRVFVCGVACGRRDARLASFAATAHGLRRQSLSIVRSGCAELLFYRF